MTRIGWLLISSILPAPVAYCANPCAACHAKQVRGYARTGMANSLFRGRAQPSGRFTHAFSGSTFTIHGMQQAIERNGFTGNHEIAYIIGSENHGFGYLVRAGDYLFQSPVSYYSKRRIWDMAPGYERDPNPDFTRPVTVECLLCHSGRPLPVEGTLNRYQQSPFAEEAISCDRCHGPTEAHLRAPSSGNIINPRKLSSRARDSVCEQCHLGGEARIPNPGRRIADFQPGRELEEILSIYVHEGTPETAASGGLKVVSHAEQLALSACARKSKGKMWCGTCHDPHDKPTDTVRYYRAKCLECHGPGLVKTHARPSENCVGCHMQIRDAKDGGHTAFTDHRISRRPPAGKPAAEPARNLVAWREPAGPLAKRNLGLAYITTGERENSAFYMDAGYRLLAGVYESSPKDPAVLTALGLVLLRKGRSAEAAQLYERALSLQPDYAPYHINVATAWNEAGDTEKAIRHIERAIRLDPSLEPAYRKLGEIYRHRNEPAKLRQTLERYLKFMPGSVTAQIALDAQ